MLKNWEGEHVDREEPFVFLLLLPLNVKMKKTWAQSSVVPQALCEFFEIVIHRILYGRGIFPKSMFVERTAYGLSVYQLMHPRLSRYVSKTFKAVLFHLKNKTLEYITLGIIVDNIPFERYKIMTYGVNDSLIKYGRDALRRVFQKLSLLIPPAIDALENVPKEATFCINLGVINSMVTPFNQEIEYTHSSWFADEFDDTITGVRVHLFRSGKINLHIFIEQNSGIGKE